MFLKFVCLVAVFIYSVQGGEDMKKVLHGQCVAETGATEDMIADANKGKFSDSDKLKCYMKCILTNLSALDDAGNFKPEVLVGMMAPEMQGPVRAMITPCAQESGANVCEKAYNINKCCFKQNSKAYFLM